MDIGKAVKQLRKQKGLTQKQLSCLAGVAQSAISNAESNGRESTVDVLQRLCRAFNMSLSDFFAYVDENGNDFNDIDISMTLDVDEAFLIEKLRMCDLDTKKRVMIACFAFMGCSPEKDKLPSLRIGSLQNGTNGQFNNEVSNSVG